MWSKKLLGIKQEDYGSILRTTKDNCTIISSNSFNGNVSRFGFSIRYKKSMAIGLVKHQKDIEKLCNVELENMSDCISFKFIENNNSFIE